MEKRVNLILSIVLLLYLFIPGTGLALEIMPMSYTLSPNKGETGTWTYDDPNQTKLKDGTYGVDDWTSSYGNNPTAAPDAWVGWKGIKWDGPGYEKADYNPVNVAIEFLLPAGETISSIVIGTNQDAINNWNVVLPSHIEATHNGQQLFSWDSTFDPNNSGQDFGGNNGRRHSLIFNFDPISTTSTDDTMIITMNNEANFNLLQPISGEAGYDYSYQGIPWNNQAGSDYNGQYWIFLDEVDFYDQHTPIPEPATIVLVGLGLPAIIAFGRRKCLG